MKSSQRSGNLDNNGLIKMRRGWGLSSLYFPGKKIIIALGISSQYSISTLSCWREKTVQQVKQEDRIFERGAIEILPSSICVSELKASAEHVYHSAEYEFMSMADVLSVCHQSRSDFLLLGAPPGCYIIPNGSSLFSNGTLLKLSLGCA
ncbi:hypothetical protein EAE96_007891 [Botrytis aclada]|nr:hypothetical protein EAE96_007891 [Botrytis aclada]